MNLENEFTRINGAFTNWSNGEALSQDLAKIQQEIMRLNKAVETEATVCSMHWDNVKDLEGKLERRTKLNIKNSTLADDLSYICCEMHSELANWDPKAGEEFEKKFNEAMKR